MADHKRNHYRAQLRAALVAGHWTSATPAEAPNGSPLSWSELLRKAKKHLKGSHEPEAASQVYYLSYLLYTTERGLEENKAAPIKTQFHLGDKCVIHPERREDAHKAHETLLRMDSTEEYVKQVLAFLAYALDRPEECLQYLRGIAFSTNLPVASPTLVVTSADEKREISTQALPTEVEDGNAWFLSEAVRCICLEGMAHERISRDDPTAAMAVYDKGIIILRSYAVPKTPPNRGACSSFDSFDKYRELWQWTERLLWRAVMLSARHRSVESVIPILRVYDQHSVHWPANFEPEQRCMICSLYLRALILLGPQHRKLSPSQTSWNSEVRSVVNEYRSVLSATTEFPRAGERNIPVEEFVDLCVAAWEAGGSIGDHSSWVLDILWWATRLTFNSPHVFRHMSRILHISGDHELAKRVARLYVQVVKKARETGTMNMKGEDTHDENAIVLESLWVETLVQGARMLCRIPGTADDAREAQELISLVRNHSNKIGNGLLASVDLADGVSKYVLARRVHEPSERSALLSESATLLKRAVERDPTPSACFHAALVLSLPIPERDLEHTIDLCMRAVEAEPKELRYWHLLALLEAKVGEWKKAKGVLEAAIEISKSDEPQPSPPADSDVAVRDFAYVNGHKRVSTASFEGVDGNVNGSALRSSLPTLLDSDQLPPASSLLQPIPDHPVASRLDRFEHALQLRMTLISLAELIEGPECVEAYWLEVFDWYSQRRDSDEQIRPTRSSLEMDQTSPLDRNITPMPISRYSLNLERSRTTLISHRHSSVIEVATDITSQVGSSIGQPGERISLESSSGINAKGGKGRGRRSLDSQNTDREKKGKRMQQILKNQVHKHQARITTISKKIGSGVARGSMNLHRYASTPADLNTLLAQTLPYQASSIHSRRRISFGSRSVRSQNGDRSGSPRAMSPPMSIEEIEPDRKSMDKRNARERRLLSDLWLMSAATFRRLEKLDQTRAAIQEAEKLDEDNEAVWVQLGLYFSAIGEEKKAIEAYEKALFISLDDIPATIHLCSMYLASRAPFVRDSSYGAVDIAAGMLEDLTRGLGWDVAEAWYLLAKAYRLQDRKDRERECLLFALKLAKVRGVRDVGAAVGWCL